MKKPLDTNVQLRINRKDLATALLYLEVKGYEISTLGQIVRIIFEGGVNALVKQGAIEITDTEQATILLSRFKTSLNREGRGKKKLIEQLQLEDARKEEELIKPTEEQLREEVKKAQLDPSQIVEENGEEVKDG